MGFADERVDAVAELSSCITGSKRFVEFVISEITVRGLSASLALSELSTTRILSHWRRTNIGGSGDVNDRKPIQNPEDAKDDARASLE